MEFIASVTLGAVVLIALLVADFQLQRFAARALSTLIDRLPPYRPGGRYRSQSSPEKYAALRRRRGGS